METKVTEIADGIFRLSTFVREVEPGGLVFNQFLIKGDETLLFHTGMRGIFPLVRDAVARLIAPQMLRWISFGHYEADECGSMNEWLALAPQAQITHGMTAVGVSLNDQADRAPRALKTGEVVDLGGKRARYIDTTHVPHGWEAGLIYEEVTGVLLCGDLFTQYGPSPAITDNEIVGAAIVGENIAGYSSLNPAMGATLRMLAALKPRTLAPMHGPAFAGDCAGALHGLADDYDRRVRERFEKLGLTAQPQRN